MKFGRPKQNHKQLTINGQNQNRKYETVTSLLFAALTSVSLYTVKMLHVSTCLLQKFDDDDVLDNLNGVQCMWLPRLVTFL